MLALLITQAYALSCIDGLADTNLSEPLPPNGVIVYSWAGSVPDAPTVRDAEGLEVPSTLVEHDGYAELVPDALLPEGDYIFNAGWDIPFTVAGDPDEEAPDPPVFLEVDRETDRSEWGTTKQLLMAFDAVPAGGYLQIELSETGDFEEDGLGVVSFWEDAWVGQGLCGTSPASYDHTSNYFLRARAIDAAGNASPWTQHEPARCGLSCSTGGAPLAGMLPLFGLLGLRRRR